MLLFLLWATAARMTIIIIVATATINKNAGKTFGGVLLIPNKTIPKYTNSKA